MAQYESPLIPNLRMKALYRALVQTRAQGGRLPKAQRHLEAPLVATAIDLHEGDLTSFPQGGDLPEGMRQMGLKATKLGTLTTKTFPGTPVDRILCALGAAMTLQSSGAVAVAWLPERLEAADWKRVLAIAAGYEPPLIVATLADAPNTLRSTPAVPVIPVDAGDTLAIYRVAQESILRARAHGGTVVIECVRLGTDPVATLAAQLLAKKIATPRWIAVVDASA